jgi:hypothetical protein
MTPKHTIELEWKAFNICLETLETWLKANAGEHYCGNSADSKLSLHFMEEPSQEIKDAIQAKWDEIDESAAEATAYKSLEDRIAEREAKKASGIAKLVALGLTEAEAQALVG